jgi:hypothetical protein
LAGCKKRSERICADGPRARRYHRKALVKHKGFVFYPAFMPPPSPYLQPFLKIRIKPLYLLPIFPYKTLGITSQDILKNILAHADPASGLPAKNDQTAIVLMNGREKTRTGSITGVEHTWAPIDFLTGLRRPAFAFPAAVRPRADAAAQPAAILCVWGDTNDTPGKSDAFRLGRTGHFTGGKRK